MALTELAAPPAALGTGGLGIGPTPIERRLYAALETLGLPYERQVWFGTYCVDAYLPDPYHIALEADGCEVHGCPTCGWDRWLRPEKASTAHQRQATLLHMHQLPVLHLWGHDLRTDEQAVESVWRALNAAGIRLFVWEESA